MEIIFLIGRVIFGGYWLMSGFNHFRMKKMLEGYTASKGIPSPSFMVMFSGFWLLIIGFALVLGIYTDIALLMLAAFLIAVSVFMHDFWKVSDPNTKMMEMIHFMKNMALLGATLIMYMIPVPWPYSVWL
ncbi:MAG: DoxX family protein [Candidatus Brennerbacteria bacterium]|nr:DoxX family protein [Candidatus Brennerbacteria bacterium]